MRRRSVRWTIRAALAVTAILAAFVLARWTTGNFGTVVPGRVYRSAQLSAGALSATIREHRIRTVLNLRGPNPDQPWYRLERQATLDAGATQVDFPMSSDQWLSHEQARTLLDILDRGDYPILIHCEWGAERTGLVAAICELTRPGGSLDEARRAFSAYYLFLPMKDGLVMRGHLDRYERWLATTGEAHSPAAFRRWLDSDYEPGSPSRQHWECNPYPLQVVSRRGSEARTVWGEKTCR